MNSLMSGQASRGFAAERAIKHWIRVKSNMSLQAYEIHQAHAPIPDPVWPDMPFSDILRVAFRDRVIDSTDHHVIKRLRGMV
jgi:hypothetical protein